MKSELRLPYSKLWTTDAPQLEIRPGQIIIKYDHELEQGENHAVTITFNRVLTYKYTDESCFTGPIELIAEGVVQLDIVESVWLQQVKQARDQFFKTGSVLYEKYGQFNFYHYGIWFDHEGTYEIIAETCEIEELI